MRWRQRKKNFSKEYGSFLEMKSNAERKARMLIYKLYPGYPKTIAKNRRVRKAVIKYFK